MTKKKKKQNIKKKSQLKKKKLITLNKKRMSEEAVLFSEFNPNLVSFSKPKKQTLGQVVNVFYNQRYLTIQTPLMNTFGISEYEGKWSLGLTLNAKNPQQQEEVAKFKAVMEDFEQKVLNDISEIHYKEWLGPSLGSGIEKWDRFSSEMRKEMVSQKIGNKFFKHSKKDEEKKYEPTMNIKLSKKQNLDDFNVSCYMMDDENRILCDEKGEYKSFDVRDHLMFDPMDKRPRPNIYCLFGICIWLVNNNIYISPTCSQILIKPVKYSTYSKISFNSRGFLTNEDYEQSEGQDGDMPMRRED